MKEKLKNQNAITLIALVVTIVVLLILAGITINMVFSNNGVIKQAQDAKNVQTNAEEQDKQAVANLMEQANSIVNPVKIISFTISNEPFQAEEGMTWEEWIRSSYNKNNRFSSISEQWNGKKLIELKQGSTFLYSITGNGPTIGSDYPYSGVILPDAED